MLCKKGAFRHLRTPNLKKIFKQLLVAVVFDVFDTQRSSHQRCSVRIGVLGNYANLQENCASLFFNSFLLKKRL